MSLYTHFTQKALQVAQESDLKLVDYGASASCIYALIERAGERYIGVALLPQGEGEFRALKGQSCEEVFQESKGYQPLQRALGLALANAVARFLLAQESISLEGRVRDMLPQKLLEMTREGEEIVFIGNMAPLIEKMEREGRKTLVFCRQRHHLGARVHSDMFEYEALQESKIAVITGAALIGSTVDAILALSPQNSVRILNGFSAGLHPSWLAGSGITHISSMLLEPRLKESLLRYEWEAMFEYGGYFLPIP